MIESFVGQVLGRPHLSPTATLAWACFLIVGPLAYFAGSILEERGMRRTAAVISTDREGARATAQAFAAAHHVDTTNWSSYASIESTDDLLEYYRLNRGTAVEAARFWSPAVTAKVGLVAPNSDRALVYMGPDGRVSSFDFTHVSALTHAAPAPQEQAEAIARASAEAIPDLTKYISLEHPAVTSLDKIGAGCRSFKWHSRSPALYALFFDVVTTVCGATPVQQSVTASVANAYASDRWGRAGRPLKVLKALYGLFMTIVVIYSIYRYVRRSMEREVSHKRTLVLAVVVGAAMALTFVSAIDEYAFGLFAAGQPLIWFPVGIVVLGFLFVGLGVAIAYGAGEGDLREFYPGKMTSLDALFRGKLLSRNVGRSALFGIALAAWMLLLQGAADWALRIDSSSLAAEVLKLPFFRFPLLALFAGRILMITITPASGLLLPLAYIGRKHWRPWLRTSLMLFFAAMGCMLNVTAFGTMTALMVGITLSTAILIGAFFQMDLLATIFGLGAFGVSTSLSRLMAVAPGWTQLGVVVGGIGIAVLVLAAWAALRGREYREEEVRPAYAGNIAVRQQMQAELAAAREAQLHLLPKAAPEINGLDITAACVPAGVVGGDFYDFFPLDDNRLGIFIAEGGNRGIGSALNIALAKGFLMHTVRRNLSPREVIQRLELSLGPLLESVGAGASTHVAYAVIDMAAGTIRYARTGDYPRVIVTGSLTAEQKFEIPGTGTAVCEGAANLRSGDTVLMFTDGIARRVRTTGPAAADGILKALSKKRKDYELEDDLTAVVVRISRPTMALLSEVSA